MTPTKSSMTRFIFMLTKDDRTVPNAMDVYTDLRGSNIRYVGFKDIGLPFTDLQRLVEAIRADGRTSMLEVVSTTQQEELRSVEAATRLGVDYLLGGKHAREAVEVLKDSRIRYFPFAGNTHGHPTRLTGSIENIVEDACMLAALPGVSGLDLLAYRFDGDVEKLARSVVQAVDVPVIAAGSIDQPARVSALREAGVWAFTVGSAIFEGRFVRDPMRQQVEAILAIEGVGA
jgi:hypothetical protein